MILQTETLKKLRELINEETQYRKGYEIVAPAAARILSCGITAPQNL